jgi:predicted RNase H-like HicB family nuclease
MRILVKVKMESQESYRAWCPSLPGCTARGQSPQEARQNVQHAIRGYLSSLDVVPPAVLEEYVMVAE